MLLIDLWGRKPVFSLSLTFTGVALIVSAFIEVFIIVLVIFFIILSSLFITLIAIIEFRTRLPRMVWSMWQRTSWLTPHSYSSWWFVNDLLFRTRLRRMVWSMWRRTQCPLALESFSFTLQNFFPPVSGEYNDDDNVNDNEDVDNLYDGGSCDGGPCFGIEHIYKDELL